MDKRKDVANIIAKYDDGTRRLYSYIAKLERDTSHKIKRQDVREEIKKVIEKVTKDENK